MARDNFQKYQSRYEIYISPLPASEPVLDILKMFEQVGAIKLKSSLEKIYCYRLLPTSGHRFASCRITYCDSRAAREAISRFNGTALDGIKMKVSPARGSYPYHPRSSTDWDCPSCQSLNFDHQASCFNCHEPRSTEERFAGRCRGYQERDERGRFAGRYRGYQERDEGGRRRNVISPAHHRRSGEDRDRGYQERREGEGRRPDSASRSSVRISKSPDVMRREDLSSRGYSRDPRSPRVPERERRLSEHQREKGRRKIHPGGSSGSTGASKRSIEGESPHRDFQREKSSGEKRLRGDDDQAAKEENIETDLLNTIRRWHNPNGPISVDIQIKPSKSGEDEINLNLNINTKNNNKSTLIDGESESSFDEENKLYQEKIKVEAKNQEDSLPNPPPNETKAAKKRQNFDYEEDQKIVNMVLDKLGDNLLSSFDIPSQGLAKLSSELNKEGKKIQARWRYSIRAWIKEDQENEKGQWDNLSSQASRDRRIQITRYFKIQTEMRRPRTVVIGQ